MAFTIDQGINYDDFTEDSFVATTSDAGLKQGIVGPPESRLLATLINNVNAGTSSLAERILSDLEPCDFSDAVHRVVFAAVQNLHEKNQVVSTEALLNHETAQREQLDSRVLANLLSASQVSNESELLSIVEGVKRSKSLADVKRTLENNKSWLEAAERDPSVQISEVVDAFTKASEALSDGQRNTKRFQVKTMADDLESVIKGLETTHGKEFLGLPTNTLPTLDKYTLGVRGFNLLAAAPGQGKTTFGLQLGLDIVEANSDAAFIFFSFEMSKQDMYRRLLCTTSGLSWKTLMCGSQGYCASFASKSNFRFSHEDQEAFDKAVTKLRGFNNRIIIFDQDDFSAVGYESMLKRVKAAKERAGVERAYILIDSLQAMPFARENGAAWSNDIERDNFAISQILRLQRTTQDALVLISEQNKDGMGKDSMKSTRGTARGVYSPDCVMVLQNTSAHSPAENDEDKIKMVETTLKIIKGRDGVYRGSIDLVFEYEHSRLRERDPDDDLNDCETDLPPVSIASNGLRNSEDLEA